MDLSGWYTLKVHHVIIPIKDKSTGLQVPAKFEGRRAGH